jgi:hypothetical protein
MERVSLDAYVLDVLMPDLVGHDRRPATFVVYLFLLRQAAKSRRDTVSVSLQTIATKTGLVDPALTATVTEPMRRVLRPWVRAK